MKERQRVESYWAVWIFNPKLGDGGHWEPFDEGITTKRAAMKAKAELEKEYRHQDERFAIVRTVNTRLPAPLKESTDR